MAFAELLNQEARALQADGVDVVQFDRPAFNVYMDDVKRWGIDALHRCIEGVTCTTAVHICYGYGIRPISTGKKRSAANGAGTRKSSRHSQPAVSTRSRSSACTRRCRCI